MPRRELAVAEAAARAAGAIVRTVYDQPYEVREKSRGNPVTEADLRADACIHAMIREAFPDDGWLSEESADSAERLTKSRVWIVDPLDGTREFIRRVPELCVCIALVEAGEPIVGVSFNPLRDEMFSAARGSGMRLNGAPARVSEVADLGRARVLASRSESARGEWRRFEGRVQVVPTGSVAYKLALVAAGQGDATFTLKPKNEWDVCAGAVLIREAGGAIGDRDGRPLRFNRPQPQLSGLVAANARLFEPICRLMREPPAPS